MTYERDRFLTELILNCDHKYEEYERPYGYGQFDTYKVCDKCGHEKGVTINFSTWPGLGKLITWLKDSEHWQKIRWHMPMAEFMELMTDPNKAANAFYEYLKTKGVKK